MAKGSWACGPWAGVPADAHDGRARVKSRSERDTITNLNRTVTSPDWNVKDYTGASDCPRLAIITREQPQSHADTRGSKFARRGARLGRRHEDLFASRRSQNS